MEIEVHAVCKQKKATAAVLTSDKNGLYSKAIPRDKKRHYPMLKGAARQGVKATLNFCVHSNTAEL